MVPIQVCVAEASSAYHVEQARIAAIMANGLPAGVERGGRVGPMAIPEQWLPIFELMGIRRDDVLQDACQNIFAGTWIVAYMASAQAAESAAAGAYSARPVRVSAQMAERRRQWAPVVQSAAASTGIPAALIDAVITVESGYQPRARSPANAIGMMQLLPSTAAMEGGGDPWDAEENIFMGARYLRQLALQFQGDLTLTLAAYNAGPAAVTRSGYRIPAFSETQSYVPKVLALYSTFSND